MQILSARAKTQPQVSLLTTVLYVTEDLDLERWVRVIQ